MDSAKIFLVDDQQEGLIPMTETAYVTEDVLQDLLARYPDLLPGDQIDPENPRRWLLVSRVQDEHAFLAAAVVRRIAVKPLGAGPPNGKDRVHRDHPHRQSRPG